MASRFTMAAVNILDFWDNSFSLFLLEKNLIGRGARRKNRQLLSQAKIGPQLAPLINKQTFKQAFYNSLTGILLDSKLQNEVVNLERLVLEAKKIALQRQL